MVDRQQVPLLTLGYGRRSAGEFFAILQRHDVRYLADVRSQPWSRFKPEFSRDQLVPALQAHGVAYIFMGDELGGQPDDPDCYDKEGRVDYLQCRRRPAFERGITRLCQAVRGGHRLAIMCSEGRPQDCHRTKLVAEDLVDRGIEVLHIDETGRILTHGEAIDRLRANQMTLLTHAPEAVVTRSRGRYRNPA